MSIFDKLFGGQVNNNPGQQQAQPNAQQQTQPGNLPATPISTEAPQGNASNVNDTNPAGTTGTESPLDKFSKLWENDPNASANANQPIGFNVDQSKLMEAASKVDFVKAIKQEDLNAIAQGGEGAVKAYQQSLNTIAQNLYAQNALATSKIVEQALAQAQEKFSSQIPDIVKRHNLSNSLREDNPALSHPAAAPILQALENQFTVKYPNATSSEIKKMAGEYLSSFASVASPPKADTTQQTSKVKEQDWGDFLTQ